MPKRKKLKAVGYITPTGGHYPRNGYMGNTDPWSDVMLTLQIIGSNELWFRAVLASEE